MKIVPTTTTTTLTVPWSGLHRKQKRRRRNLKSSNKDRCGGLWSRSYRALFVSEPSSFFTQYTFKPSFKYHVQKSIAKSTHTPSSRRMKDINAGGIHLLRSGIKISFCRLACFKRTGLISTFSLNSNAKSQDTPPTTFASASKRVWLDGNFSSSDFRGTLWDFFGNYDNHKRYLHDYSNHDTDSHNKRKRNLHDNFNKNNQYCATGTTSTVATTTSTTNTTVLLPPPRPPLQKPVSCPAFALPARSSSPSSTGAAANLQQSYNVTWE